MAILAEKWPEKDILLTLLTSPLWIVIYVIFVLEASVGHKEEALRGFILHQYNPPCRDVDTNKKLKPCTLTTQENYQRLRSRNSNCLAPSGMVLTTWHVCHCLWNQWSIFIFVPQKRVILTQESDGMTTGKKSLCQDYPPSVVCVMHKLAGVWMECSRRTWCIWWSTMFPWTARSLCLLYIVLSWWYFRHLVVWHGSISTLLENRTRYLSYLRSYAGWSHWYI